MKRDTPKADHIRRMAVAGSFYPSDREELCDMLERLFNSAGDEGNSPRPQAIIVPHAGYVFSGNIAAKGYSAIPVNAKYKRIFMLGPSHVLAFDGASVNTSNLYYETPLGTVEVDSAICKKLVEDSKAFNYIPKAHGREHCLEVQLPFMQYRFKSVPPIVPIIIGTTDIECLEEIATSLLPYFNDDNLFVISSDFSHYPCYDDARKADLNTVKAICTGYLSEFANALNENSQQQMPNLMTSACGAAAIAVLMIMAERTGNMSFVNLGYENSGDSEYGGKDKVVGYNAFAIVRNNESSGNGFVLTDAEKHTLLYIARQSIEGKVNGVAPSFSIDNQLTNQLQQECGAFVTLREDGRLRGCIGNIEGEGPLHKLVKRMAVAAATEDPRFEPLTQSELYKISIEISVLTPLKRVYSPIEIVLGRDGVLMICQGRHGTFLPQVANETGWTKEEFLGHLSRDKAGLGWDDWKNAQLYTYRAIVFGEEK